MPCPSPRRSIFLCLLAPSIATAQNFLPLDFSQHAQATNLGVYYRHDGNTSEPFGGITCMLSTALVRRNRPAA